MTSWWLELDKQWALTWKRSERDNNDARTIIKPSIFSVIFKSSVVCMYHHHHDDLRYWWRSENSITLHRSSKNSICVAKECCRNGKLLKMLKKYKTVFVRRDSQLRNFSKCLILHYSLLWRLCCWSSTQKWSSSPFSRTLCIAKRLRWNNEKLNENVKMDFAADNRIVINFAWVATLQRAS